MKNDQIQVSCSFRKESDYYFISSSIEDKSTFRNKISTTELSTLVKSWRGRAFSRISSGAGINDDQPNTIDIEFGYNLLKLLFPVDEIKNLNYVIDNPGQVLLISIISSDNLVAEVPWEICAYSSWRKLGLNIVPKILFLRTPFQNGSHISINEPVKILVIGASPKRQPVVNFRQELKTITNRLNESIGNQKFKRFSIESNNGLDFIKLGKIIKNNCPDILHIATHGGRGEIDLEDLDDNPETISVDELYSALKNGNGSISILFLSSCLSLTPAEDNKILGSGGSLSKLIPIIIGMGLPISTDMLDLFISKFYYAIGNSKSILHSFIIARESLFKKRPGSPEWGAPIIMQNPIDEHAKVFKEDTFNLFIEETIKNFADVQDRLSEDLYSKNGWEDLLSILKFIDKNLLRSTRLSGFNLTPTQKGKINGNIKPLVVKVRGKTQGIIRLLTRLDDNIELEFKYDLSEKSSETQGMIDGLVVSLNQLKNKI